MKKINIDHIFREGENLISPNFTFLEYLLKHKHFLAKFLAIFTPIRADIKVYEGGYHGWKGRGREGQSRDSLTRLDPVVKIFLQALT